MKRRWRTATAILMFALSRPAVAQSVFTTRPDDPRAVTLSAEEFGARGDGLADDSAALQAAIDKANNNYGEGLVFIPAGHYRLTRTLYVWTGVRLIGFGATRPVFLLADDTPRFPGGCRRHGDVRRTRPGSGQRGDARVAVPPQGSVPATDGIPDAHPSSFYSAMSNIDFSIGTGNAAAVAIRFHVAQHSYLSHMDFEIGSGLAASRKWEMRPRICISTADATVS